MSRYENISKLASSCRTIALALARNEPGSKIDARNTLLDARDFIESCVVSVHKKRDGLLIVNGQGKSRYMTFRERLAYAILGKTAIEP